MQSYCNTRRLLLTNNAAFNSNKKHPAIVSRGVLNFRVLCLLIAINVFFFLKFQILFTKYEKCKQSMLLLNKIVVTFYKQISIFSKNIQIAFLNGFFL